MRMHAESGGDFSVPTIRRHTAMFACGHVIRRIGPVPVAASGVFLCGVMLSVLVGCGSQDSTSNPPFVPPPAPELVVGTSSGTVMAGGVSRTYLVHNPSASGPKPLVLVLHGGSGSGAQAEHDYGFDMVSDAQGCVVAYPDGVAINGVRKWANGSGTANDLNGIDDVQFLRILVASLSGQTTIDQRRIYCCGISSGGMMSQRFGMAAGDLVAAIAPVAGSLPASLAGHFTPVAPISVLEFHGTSDSFVPYDGGTVTTVGGGQVASVLDTLAAWTVADGIVGGPVVTLLPDIVPSDGTRVEHWTYPSGVSGTQVELYRVIGGGHTWPNSAASSVGGIAGVVSYDINATSLIWAFFASHPKAGTSG